MRGRRRPATEPLAAALTCEPWASRESLVHRAQSRIVDAVLGKPQSPPRRESDLYPAVKAFLEGQGYDVKGEIRGCDVVATRGDEPPVIVELKLAFNLALVLQGVDRLALTDRVYLAVARPPSRRTASAFVYRSEVRKLCRRLGLGLMTVASGRRGDIEILVDPTPYRPRKDARRVRLLLGEHARRQGDPNCGGVTKTPIVTAYRQEALRCALLIEKSGRGSPKALRETGVVPNAARILGRDVYGWFRRVERGIYCLSDRAREDIARFAEAGRLPNVDQQAGKAPYEKAAIGGTIASS